MVIPILTYHKIGTPEKNTRIKGLYTSEWHLKMQIFLLKKFGYEFIFFKDILLGNIPRKPILLTFDDGHRDNYLKGFNVIKKQNIKITIFIVTGDIGKKDIVWNNSAEKQPTEIFSWQEAKEMLQSELVDIQSHGMSHLYLNKINKKSLKFELEKPFELFKSNLGYYPIAIAYPYGGFNETVCTLSEEIGYKFGCTTDSGLNDLDDLDKFKLKRISVKGYKFIHFLKFLIKCIRNFK